jgi:hypothetical protein
MARKQPAPQPYAKPDQIQIRGNQIFSRVRQKWLVQTPEELVRQIFLDVVLNEYGFSLHRSTKRRNSPGADLGMPGLISSFGVRFRTRGITIPR